MKVAFAQQAMARLGAHHEDDRREVRDLVRRLRSATNPVGKRVGGQVPTYETSLGQNGVLIRYEVLNGVATVEAVLSAPMRQSRASSDDAFGDQGAL